MKTSFKKNDRSLTEVLTGANFKKVMPLVEYIEKNGKITLHEAEEIIGKSTSATYRYLALLVDAGVLERTGNTSNLIYTRIL